MSWIQAYGIFIALLMIFSTKIHGHPMPSSKSFHSSGSKWRPFNSVMNERLMPFRPEDSLGSNPVALHVQGLPQVIQFCYLITIRLCKCYIFKKQNSYIILMVSYVLLISTTYLNHYFNHDRVIQ